jgi:hypothetical protein
MPIPHFTSNNIAPHASLLAGLLAWGWPGLEHIGTRDDLGAGTLHKRQLEALRSIKVKEEV